MCDNVLVTLILCFFAVPFTAFILFDSVGSIPCSEDFVPQMVCGCCYIQCFPNFGVCSPPPEAKALQFLTEKPAATTDAPAATEPMERGGDKEDPAMEESLQE
jgi:hypothetical protein